jgi:hypothetical protein
MIFDDIWMTISLGSLIQTMLDYYNDKNWNESLTKPSNSRDKIVLYDLCGEPNHLS